VSSVHLRWGLVSLALLSCALPFHAQTVSNEGQAPTATFKVESRAVDVDVIVLDNHGQPVKGLRREDFVVTEDGIPQTATFFEEHLSETASPDAAANVLLIDTLNTPKDDLIYVRTRVADFLKKMPPGTSLEVFSLGQTLRIVQGFTSDRATLLAAVENNKTGVWSGTSPTSNMPLDDADDRMRAQQMEAKNPMANSADMIKNGQAMHKTYQNDQRIAMTVAALQRLARYLAKTPGRKNLIWFSSAFPIAVFPEPDVRGSLATTNQNQQIKETTDLLALARVAIYPVNGQGVAATTTGDASDYYGVAKSNLPETAPTAAPPSGTTQQSTGGDDYSYGALSNELRHEDSAHAANYAAMHALASETGGEVLPNSNDLSGMLARAIRNGSQYYALSYTPANKNADGKFRRIEVKLRNGTDRLAYRRGYYATDAMLGPSPGASANVAKSAAPDSDPLTPLMRSGMAALTQIPYDVRAQVTNPQPAPDAPRAGGNAKLAGPVTRYGVEFVIHRAAETTAPPGPGSDNTHPDRMQVEVIAFDANGKALNWQAGTMNLKPSNGATAQERRIHTSIELDVPRDAVSLTTGVYDWSTGQAGTRQIALADVSTAEASPGLTSPATAPASATAREPKLAQRAPEPVKQTAQP
jgi:VWFA-related protein